MHLNQYAFYFITPLICCLSYQMKCPDASQWTIRAENVCRNEKSYICLFDVIKDQFVENCNGPYESPDGTKAVIKYQLDITDCSADRYQFHIFTTFRRSICEMLKSKCTAEGQLISDNGTTISDRSCLCDNSQGYSFVSMPLQISCVPSTEDCSCSRNYIKSHGHNPTQQNTSTQMTIFFNRPNIGELEFMQHYNHTGIITTSLRKDVSDLADKTLRSRATLSVFIAIAILLIIISILVLNTYVADENSKTQMSVLSYFPIENKRRQFLKMKLVQLLGLSGCYPSKICANDVRIIQVKIHSKTIRDIPWIILYKILCLDNCWLDCLDDISNISDEDYMNTADVKRINFLDMFNVIFLCCNLDLKQELCSKLALCRLPFPFLYENNVGQIVVAKWCLRKVSVNVNEKVSNILQQKLKIVTFVRCGKRAISTSKLLNGIFNYQCFPTFSHKDFDEKQFSNIVLSAWYVDTDTSSENVYMLLDVPEDVFNRKETLQIIQKISHVVVFHLPGAYFCTQTQKEIAHLLPTCNLIYLLESEKNDDATFDKYVPKHKKSDRHIEVLCLKKLRMQSKVQNVRKAITDITSEIYTTTLNEQLKHLKTDEESSEISNAINCANNILKRVTEEKYNSAKRLCLECFTNFNLLHQEKRFIEKCKLKKNLLSGQRKALKLVVKMLGAADQFELKRMFQKVYNKQDIWLTCFSECVEIITLDKLKETMPLECFGELLCHSKNGPQQNVDEFITNYLKFICRLLISGKPFKFMNGEFNMVNTELIRSAFQMLIKELGDRKILTVSILGTPQSGKTTLLTSLFGIPVNKTDTQSMAGMCMQLLKINESKDKFYSYVLVIDSWGLPAESTSNEEFMSQEEFVLFILGVSNITIINTKEEGTISSDGIFESYINAISKLTALKDSITFPQSCIFVCQPNNAASERHTLSHIDYSIKERLKQVAYKTLYQEDRRSFDHVIAYVKENIMCVYMPIFWFSALNVVSVNPGYINKVKELKDIILFNIPEKMITFLNFSESALRMHDIWNGILSNDFVSHFVCSINKKAYHNLEIKFQSLTLKLENTMINHVLSDINLRFAIANSDPNIKQKASSSMIVLRKSFNAKREQCCKCLITFAEDSSLCEISLKHGVIFRQQLIKYANEMLTKYEECINGFVLQILRPSQTKDIYFHNECNIPKLRDKHMFSTASTLVLKQQFSRLAMKKTRQKKKGKTVNGIPQEIASSLIATIQDLIENEINTYLPFRIFQTVSGECHLSKHSLLIAILKDLADNEKFEDFLQYLKDSKTFAEKWLKARTDHHIFDDYNGQIKYDNIVRELIVKYLEAVKESLMFATNSVMVESKRNSFLVWLTLFQIHLSKTIPLLSGTFEIYSNLQSVDCFEIYNYITMQLDEVKKVLLPKYIGLIREVPKFNDINAYKMIFDKLWGCTQTCPSCGEPCRKLYRDHKKQKHLCLQHKPVCLKSLNGRNSACLSFKTCSFDFQFEDGLRLEANAIINDWEINQDPLLDGSKYWTWFMYTFQEELKAHFQIKEIKYADAYEFVTKEEAINSLF